MALFGVLERATVVDILGELAMFIAPLWIAVIFGVIVGWAWKPKWANNLGSIEPNDNAWSFNFLKLRLPWAFNSSSGPQTDPSFSISATRCV